MRKWILKVIIERWKAFRLSTLQGCHHQQVNWSKTQSPPIICHAPTASRREATRSYSSPLAMGALQMIGGDCGLRSLSSSSSSTGPWFNIKMTSYQYRKSHCEDKTILRPSYLHNGISYRRIADVRFELHFRVTPGQFRSAAASSLHRRQALLATSTRPSFS